MTVHAILNESTGQVEVTDEMHELLNGMVDVLESADYEIDGDIDLPNFMEAVEYVLANDEELDEGKKEALTKAHATVAAVVKAAKPASALKHAEPDEEEGGDNDEKNAEYEPAPKGKCAKCEGCECQKGEEVTEEDAADDEAEESEKEEKEEGEEEKEEPKKKIAKKDAKHEKHEKHEAGESDEEEAAEHEEEEPKEESVKTYSHVPGWATHKTPGYHKVKHPVQKAAATPTAKMAKHKK